MRLNFLVHARRSCFKARLYAKIFGFVCLAVLPIAGVYGQNLQEVIPVHSKAYQLLDDLLLESGRVPTSNVRPYTKAQFLLAMALVNRDTLSDQGIVSLNRLQTLLEPKSLYLEKGLFSFRAGLSGGFEGYFKTDASHAERYKAYGNRIPMVAIPLSLDFADFLSLAVDFDMREEYFAVNEDSAGWNALNVPGQFAWLDISQPLYTNLSLGNDHFNLSIGRNQMTVGPGVFSKLLISDNADYLEYLALKTFWDVFTFTVLVVNLDPGLMAAGTGDTGSTSVTTGETLASGEQAIKNFFLHRSEISLFDQRLNIGLSEGYMIGGASPELKHFNPLMVFHDYYNWDHASSIFSADVSINPWKFLNVYGQYVFNQVTTSYESGTYGVDTMPNAQGFMAGLQFRMPLGEGYLGAVGEFWYTDPWLYIRETPLTSYAWRRTIVSNLRGKGAPVVISRPLGFKYGPDSVALDFSLSYDWKDLLHAELNTAYVMRGQLMGIDYFDPDQSNHMSQAATQMVTPTGIAEKTLSFILSAAFTPFDWLQIDASLATYIIENSGHVQGARATDVQGSLGVQFFLGRKPVERR